MYSKIAGDFWTDEKLRELDNKYLYSFLYFISCPHRNMAGLYFIPIPYASYDLKITPEKVMEHLTELCKCGLIDYDSKKSIILVKNFLKYNEIENDNQAKGLKKIVQGLPVTELFLEFKEILANIDNDKLHKCIETLEERIENELLPILDTERNTSVILSKGLTNPSETLPKPFRIKKQNQKKNKKEEKEEETEKEAEEKKILDIEFEEVWKEYPNKEGKSKAREGFSYWRNKGFTSDQLYAAVKNYRAKKELEGTETKFIKHGSTFFSKDNEDLEGLVNWERPINGNGKKKRDFSGLDPDKILEDYFSGGSSGPETIEVNCRIEEE